jgi:hypothetical protein
MLLVYVKPSEIIKLQEPDKVVSYNNRKNEISDRLDKVINHIRCDGYMNPPLICYNKYSKEVNKYPIEANTSFKFD